MPLAIFFNLTFGLVVAVASSLVAGSVSGLVAGSVSDLAAGLAAGSVSDLAAGLAAGSAAGSAAGLAAGLDSLMLADCCRRKVHWWIALIQDPAGLPTRRRVNRSDGRN
ncbi:hypothetical protein MGG_17230 [Pyricularia oryzae 70-15]|uniref:Uncharacterized protein n=1 Tax=Pyricularia oryzae (strain 70-15 / ATCC MYA-4617 / FGSC 8958) TaxID=242507 RepID=G4N912_PYRO7|nr:uncharacterized protein MGG_17230 [Pyricularia oryzae 70-15]EHA51107.1 hypothetical protein MGG_17230 [Pyricularia oryzae 70-15]